MIETFCHKTPSRKTFLKVSKALRVFRNVDDKPLKFAKKASGKLEKHVQTNFTMSRLKRNRNFLLMLRAVYGSLLE